MSEEIKVEKIRKVFLEDLPRNRFGKYQADGVIDWKNTVGKVVKFIYDDIKGEINILAYDFDTRYLHLKYLNNPIFKMKTPELQNCKLKGLLGLKTSEFKIEIGTVFEDSKRNITITDRRIVIEDREYKNKKNKSKSYIKYYKYKCNICGFDCGEHYRNQEYKEDLWTPESNLLTQNQGCSCCNNKIVVEHINSIVAKEETKWMIPYFQGGYGEAKLYTCRSKHKIYLKCPNCGRVKDKVICIDNLYSNKAVGCVCSDNIPYTEKFLIELLKQLNVKFKYQYYPKWCVFNDINGKQRKGIYDFKLEDSIFLIETDGGFHSKDNSLSGIGLEDSIFIDNEKDRLAKENNYEVIRINCNYNTSNRFEYMKNSVLNSKINTIFDLSKIDWEIINKFALSNLVRVVCEYKRSDIELSVLDLCKIMNMGKSSITAFLKQGNDMGWCIYDAKSEMRKGNSKRINKGEKQVICLNNNQVFKSAKNLDAESEKIFGVKLDYRSIGGVCRKETKQHKGYSFMFYEEYLLLNN